MGLLQRIKELAVTAPKPRLQRVAISLLEKNYQLPLHTIQEDLRCRGVCNGKSK
jgi:hypothetical protein